MPLWNRQQEILADVIQKLPIKKFKHSFHSKYADEKVVQYLETYNGQKSSVWGGLQKRFMPLPTAIMVFPRFR